MNVIIETAKPAPLAETPYDPEQGDVPCSSFKSAIYINDQLVRKTGRPGRIHREQWFAEPRGSVYRYRWIVQDVRGPDGQVERIRVLGS